jgi:surface antigen
LRAKRWKYLLVGLIILIFIGLNTFKKYNFNKEYVIGQKIDSLNGVYVYFNGGVDHVSDRNTTSDGYNLGLKYQCVEFVKRYYYEHLNHKMPDSYGHAKDYYDKTLNDGQKNTKRNLSQFSNPSFVKPKVDDLLIFSGSIFNKYGHVAIISNVADTEVEIIQQNPGPFGSNGKWEIKNDRILGWLRKD